MELTEHLCKDAVGSVLSQKDWRLPEEKRRKAERITFTRASKLQEISWDQLLGIAEVSIRTAWMNAAVCDA